MKAHIMRGEDGWYVAECYNLPVVTQGHSLDETASNLREAVALVLDDGDHHLFGFQDANPPIVVTLELEPAHAA